MELILPSERFPMVSFLILILLFFVSMDFILTIVSVLSTYTQLSHIVIGLTLTSWGSCPIELINLIIASKKGELQIGLTSILSGIVFTFLILIPLAMLFKMVKKQTHEIELLQPLHSSHMMFVPAIIASVLATVVFWKSKMRIRALESLLLITIYVGYLGYMIYILNGDSS